MPRTEALHVVIPYAANLIAQLPKIAALPSSVVQHLVRTPDRQAIARVSDILLDDPAAASFLPLYCQPPVADRHHRVTSKRSAAADRRLPP